MRRALHHALYGAALTVLTVAVTFLWSFVVSTMAAGPMGPTGDLALLSSLVGAFGMLGVLAVSVGVGYREQRRNAVSGTYRRFAGAFLAGGIAPLLLAVLGLAAVGVLADTPTAMMTVAGLLSAVVAMPVVSTVAALAGVTLAALPTNWQLSDAPFGRPLVVPVGAAVVAGGSFTVDSVTRLLTSLSPTLGIPAWLPQFETIGVTVTVYMSLDSAVSGVVLVAGAVALGAHAARRHGFDSSVRRFVVLVTAGGVVGVTLVPAAVTAGVTGVSLAEFFGNDGILLFGVVSLAGAYVQTAVVGTLAALAGLGAATFEAGGDGESAVTDAAAETPADGPAAADRDERSEFSPADGAPR